ncbi:hypothetical protein GOODEAATRI_017501 [Goodea atripinnis]|uniref:Uncharacterized protein n=1 Tax=Goodea atripinnis TaxID=208336 RepID=A0ABV0NL23_9TELE
MPLVALAYEMSCSLLSGFIHRLPPSTLSTRELCKSEAKASLVLTLVPESMPLHYSAWTLRGLDSRCHVLCTPSIQQHGLPRSFCPLHRGVGRMFSYHTSSSNAIASLWSYRSPSSATCHHNKPHVKWTNPHCLHRTTNSSHLKLSSQHPLTHKQGPHPKLMFH